MFKEFVPLQLECLSDYSQLIPGALDTVEALRKRGYKIGSTTGYTLGDDEDQPGATPRSRATSPTRPSAPPTCRTAGPIPSCACRTPSTSASPRSRPASRSTTPVPGVEEGLNAGMWTIGLAISGNEIGLLAGRIGRSCRRPTRSVRRQARLHAACTSPAPTTSSTASPTSCPASTTSKPASPAASGRSTAPPSCPLSRGAGEG